MMPFSFRNEQYFNNLFLPVHIKIKNKVLSVLKVLIASVVLCNIISGCSDTDIATGTGTTCPPRKEHIPLKASLREIDIFMDVSGSMKGFMPVSKAATDFQVLVPDLMQRLNRDLPSAFFFPLGQRGLPATAVDIRNAREQIAYGRFQFGMSSALPEMLDSIENYSGNDKAAILITDGIYSPSASKSRLRDQVITDISSVLVKGVKKNCSVACFQLLSFFNETVSPYYLFVCGSPQNVWLIREKLNSTIAALNNSLQHTTYNEIHFGFPEATPFYSIIPYVDNTGAGEPAECTEWDNRYLVMENVEIQNKPACWIGLDLSALPEYALQSKYLKDNLQVSTNGLKAAITGAILNKQQFIPKVTDAVDKTLANKCTHFVWITISQLEEQKGEITFSLKKTAPEWISEYSHSREDSAETKRDKTFGLTYIIDGMHDAYSNVDSACFFKDLKVIVIKK